MKSGDHYLSVLPQQLLDQEFRRFSYGPCLTSHEKTDARASPNLDRGQAICHRPPRDRALGTSSENQETVTDPAGAVHLELAATFPPSGPLAQELTAVFARRLALVFLSWSR